MKKAKIKINQRRFFLNILLPTILTFGLFIILIFSFIIPYVEESLLDAKKQMTRELVNACSGIASKYHAEAVAGMITEEEAQMKAISRIEHLRYGINNKDYFWITDMRPVMIMHPYRADLNNQDLTEFRDPEGKAMFVEMVNVVKQDDAGYVDYMWQWMDDSTRIVPKISYVSKFEPWGWVIGTGVYIEDVRTEIAAIIQRLLLISLGISIIMIILLFIIVRNNLKAERKRRSAEDDLKESRERYKALVEASDEGTLMILNSRCVYSNHHVNVMIDTNGIKTFSEDLHEIIHPSCVGDMEKIKKMRQKGEAYMQLETLLLDRFSNTIPVLLSLSVIEIEEEKGMIILIRDLSTDKSDIHSAHHRSSPLWLLAENLGYGAFRAQPGRKGRFIKANMRAARILGFNSKEEMLQHNILDLVEEPEERIKFLRTLTTAGSVKDFPLHIKRSDEGYADILVTATLIENEDSGLPYSEGFFEDQTERLSREKIKDNLLSELQSITQKDTASSATIAGDIISCLPETSISDAIALMNTHQRTALLIKTSGDLPLGILSERIIRERISYILDNPLALVADIMHAPIISVHQDEPLYAANEKMLQSASGVVLVKDQMGKPHGLIEAMDFLRIGMNPLRAMETSVDQAVGLNELSGIGKRLPLLVSVMIQSGAKPGFITGLITAVSDRITQRIAQIITAEMGPPPAPFAFICMGSQGRREQTLVTDQDNAIIYESIENAEGEAIAPYFLKFGKKMNLMLAEAGYELCNGDFMAGNPKWNQPLSKWKSYFNDWIMNPEPQHLLDSGIFFDFRCVFGTEDLANKLRESIDSALATQPAFFGQMAKICINYKIPLGMFGKIQTEAKENQENAINIKNAIRLIVNMVRLYAMQNQNPATGTPQRMLELFSKNVISSALYADLLYAFEFMSLLQLKNQTQQDDNMIPMDHYLDLALLPGIEIEMLKAVFSKLTTFQSKIKYDFGLSGN